VRYSKSSSHIHVGYCGARSVSTVVSSSVVVMMTTVVEDEDDDVHK